MLTVAIDGHDRDTARRERDRVGDHVGVINEVWPSYVGDIRSRRETAEGNIEGSGH